jgi:hypothetical protein
MMLWLGTVLPVHAAYEHAYEKTPVGTIEVKELPAVTALSASGPGAYFSNSGSPFMTLFRFIQKNEIPMTVPVEADVDVNRMRFFVGPSRERGDVAADAGVQVQRLPARTVVSMGLRGSYTQKRFEHGLREVRAWLERQESWTADGQPYAVYWNAPYVPGWFKRSEVHVPVRPVTP